MKVKRASYMDDDILIPGVLIERLFRRPVFFSADARCGWESQVIYKEHQSKVIVWSGTPQAGKSYFCGPDDMSDAKKKCLAYFESVEKELSTYDGCTKQQMLDAMNDLLAYINKFDEPIWATPDFLLLIDGINGLSRGLGEAYCPSMELQRKYINTLCSLAQDVMTERACKKSS